MVCLWIAFHCSSRIHIFLTIVLTTLTACLTHQVSIYSEENMQPRSTLHSHVMSFTDDAGKDHPVASNEEWSLRRKDILVGFQACTGLLPDRTGLGPVRYTVDEEMRRDTPDVQCMKLMIDSDEGDFIPAWLLIHKNIRQANKRAPAILALHQTNGTLGKDEVAGLGGLPNLHYGLELAHRGYIVLAPDYPSLGEYRHDFSTDRHASGSMKGIWNHMRCVDLLQEHVNVDPNCIAAIGHSLGGHNAIFVGVFDERIKAVVTSCGWTPMHDYYNGKLDGWAGERYLPRLKELYCLDADQLPFDFYELVASIAPRGFFSCSPIGDNNFSVAGVRKAIPVAGEVYKLFNQTNRLQVRYPDCGHDFPQSIREESYQFLDSVLKISGSP